MFYKNIKIMETCPYCEWEISNTAKKCKHCWERLIEKSESIKELSQKEIRENYYNNFRKILEMYLNKWEIDFSNIYKWIQEGDYIFINSKCENCSYEQIKVNYSIDSLRYKEKWRVIICPNCWLPEKSEVTSKSYLHIAHNCKPWKNEVDPYQWPEEEFPDSKIISKNKIMIFEIISCFLLSFFVYYLTNKWIIALISFFVFIFWSRFINWYIPSDWINIWKIIWKIYRNKRIKYLEDRHRVYLKWKEVICKEEKNIPKNRIFDFKIKRPKWECPDDLFDKYKHLARLCKL